MNKQSEQWLQEQQRVNDVVNVIERKQAYLKESTGTVKKSIIKLRKSFWDDVTVNLDEPDDIIETEASIKQQAELLSERERSHGRMSVQLKTLDRLHDAPYFGRIDFWEENEKEIESLYIGVASLMDEKDEEFLIYDWRAPISSMYYDYTVGPAAYNTMDGPIQGDISLKRQFIIKNCELEGLFDTGITIGDHLLQSMLGKHSSTKMKSIVSTIQKEQNRIIRNEKSKFLVVQGAAGSGKTSAVLQRIAYLLYAHREILNSKNMLLFSPNPLFNSYVATVLPELGEENMRQTTFQEYAAERLDDQFLVEDPFEQMEAILTDNDNIRIEAIQYKASLEFKQMIDKYLATLNHQGLLFHDITFRGNMIVSGDEIEQHFYNLASSISISNRLEMTADWLLEKVLERERHEQYQDWVTEEIELLDKEDYMHAYHEAQRNQADADETFDDVDQEWEILSQNVIEEHFQPIKRGIKRLEFVNVQDSYRQLFEEKQAPLLGRWQVICERTKEKLDKNELAWEEVTPYLYFLDHLKGRKSYTHIRHVFIDEAQDYSPFQIAYLKKLFPQCRMTILGDINQAIYAHAIESPSMLTEDIIGDDKQETITLLRSYRSTRQIVEFTRQLIKGGEAIEPFNRDGKKPTLTVVNDEAMLNQQILKHIDVLQSEGYETIAIICRTMAESKATYAKLKSEIDLQLMDQETYTFSKGLLILPAYLAKGIEFDAVIIHDASVYNKESERKLFYTACTRAMHELHLYSKGEGNMFIQPQWIGTYLN